MSNFDSGSSDRSGRAQKASRESQLVSDLSKGLDTQHHNTSLMHEFGSAFEAPQTVSTNSSSATGSVGQAPSPARSDHQHGAEVATWIYPVLLNGWANYGGGWTPVRYCKLSGVVYCQGLMAGGAFNVAAYTLSTGYRPLGGNLMFAMPNSGGQAGMGRVDVDSSGGVAVVAGWGSNTFYSLTFSFVPGA